MTLEENRKNKKEQDHTKQIHRKRMRKRRQRMYILMQVWIVVLFGICSFVVGKSVWEKVLQITEALEESGEPGKSEGSKLHDQGTIHGEEFPELETAVESEKMENSRIESDGQNQNDKASNKKNGDEILLVNKENRLPEDYKVELITLPDGSNRAAKEAYGPLMDMMQAAKKEGLHLVVCSSYRDVAYQKKLFEEDVRVLMYQGYTYEQAYEEVAKETMPPGYSEHSTGLAFDIVSLDYQLLDAGQEKTAENRWLREHCAEYGFILRYPKGKEDITQINYESWHFRYVGKEIAQYIMENGIALEEYLVDMFCR